MIRIPNQNSPASAPPAHRPACGAGAVTGAPRSLPSTGRGGSRGRPTPPGRRAPGAQKGQGRKGSDRRRAEHHVGARRGRGGGHSAPTCRTHPAPLKGKGKVTRTGGAGERAGPITQAPSTVCGLETGEKEASGPSNFSGGGGVGEIKTARQRGDAPPACDPRGPRTHAFAPPRRAGTRLGRTHRPRSPAPSRAPGATAGRGWATPPPLD